VLIGDEDYTGNRSFH